MEEQVAAVHHQNQEEEINNKKVSKSEIEEETLIPKPHMKTKHTKKSKSIHCPTLFFVRFSEFGDDGGPAAKTIVPKFSVFSKHVTAHTGFQVPDFEIKLLVAGAIALKGFGSLLFLFGSTIGAFLLILHQLIATPILYDFYNYDTEKKEFTQLFIKFTQNLALLGALMFFIVMKGTTPRRSGNKKRHSKSKAA